MNKARSFIALLVIGALAPLSVGCSGAPEPGTEATGSIEQNVCIDLARYATAFRGNNGHLWVDTNRLWSGDTGAWIVDNTSPSIAQLQNSQYVVAFNGGSCNGCLLGDLWIVTGTAKGQSGYDATTSYTHNNISPTTSPSITRLTDNGYAVAYQDLNSELWVYVRYANGSTYVDHAMCSGTPCKMKSGTSPSITGLPDGSYQVVFQAPRDSRGDNYLWSYSPSATWGSTGNLWYGMLAATNPSIAWVSNWSDYADAFNANTNKLWIVDGWSFEDQSDQAMAGGTSPAIAAASNSYRVAYQNPSFKLCTWDAFQGGTGNCNYNTTMKQNTSPSIAWVSSSSYETAVQGSDGYLYYSGPMCKKGKQTAKLNNSTSPSISVAGLAW
jgi:hypothetical protein